MHDLRAPLPALLMLTASLLALLAATPAEAQDAAAPQPLLVDPVGDVTLQTADLPRQPNVSTRYASTDLMSLAFEEAALEFTFTLTLATLDAQEPIGEAAVYNMAFVAEDVPYILRLWAPRTDEDLAFQAMGGGVYRVDPATPRGEVEVAIVPTVVDPAAGTIRATVPRAVLTTTAAAPLGHGQALRGLAVTASAGINASNEAAIVAGPDRVPVLRARDQMPDSGGVDIVLQLGGLSAGTLRLSSPAALRATNGGPGSFLLHATVHNDGADDATVALGLLRSPPEWSVGLATTAVQVGAGASETVDLVVTPSSRHEHGTLHTFLLEARDAADAANYAQLEMGLHFVDPPQPAGHHPVLYVHVRDTDPSVVGQAQEALLGGARIPYLTTLEEDPLDDGVGVQAGGFLNVDDDGRPVRDYHWSMDLHPGLLLGLELADGPLLASFTLQASVPVDEFTADGIVAHVAPDGRVTPLWDFRTAPANAAPGAAFTVAGEGSRLAQRSVFPFEPGAGLRLYLNATAYGADVLFGVATVLLEGGELRLPLAEYQDEVAVAGEVTEVAAAPAASPTPAAESPFAAPGLAALALAGVAAAMRGRRGAP